MGMELGIWGGGGGGGGVKKVQQNTRCLVIKLNRPIEFSVFSLYISSYDYSSDEFVTC